MNDLKDRLLRKIEARELTMRPRAYFVARLVLLAVVVALILAASVFIFNFIFFTTRVSGQGALFTMGFSGVIWFIRLFPWPLLLIDLLLVLLLEHLLRRFRLAYRQPTLYLFLALLALAISAGLFLDRVSDWNDRLLHQADRDTLPSVIRDFYRGARRLPPVELRSDGDRF